MLRNLAVLMSALVALSAQAQDASTPQGEEKPAPAAPSTGGEQSQPAMAAKAPEENARPPLSPTAPRPKPDAGVDASTRSAPTDCGMEDSLFADVPIPFAMRVYGTDTPATSPQELGRRQWYVEPQVRKAGRCLQKYVIQVQSKSKKPWSVKEAKLEGSDGEILEVIDIRSRLSAGNRSINIIIAERTGSGTGPNYMLATLRLIGEDGQVIVIQNVVLP